MNPRRTYIALLLLIAAAVLFWRIRAQAPPEIPPRKGPVVGHAAPTYIPEPGDVATPKATAPSQGRGRALADLLELMRARLARSDARANEAVLTFNSAEAYRRFLARAGQTGLTLSSQLDPLNTVRVRYDSLETLQRELAGNTSDYQEVSANYLVSAPRVPTPEERTSVDEIPFGQGMLEFLGATGDRSDWGRGVTIAVLDSGVSPDATFGAGRLQTLDIGLGFAPGTGANDGHGTAVASLAAGEGQDAPGIASAAGILSIRVTDADGLSDIYTLAQGIVAAVDAGAKIINISMGGYQTNAALTQALNYASTQGAVIVASAGNDEAAQLTWPAADPKVVSVGAVDALGQQVSFSNSGPQLQVTAPGYGVQAAWLDGTRVSLDGTSASAPIVAGAIAAVMSESQGLSAADAWKVLQAHTSEGGQIGSDPAYGSGILNVGSTMNRNDQTYIDTAIASHYYDPATSSMVIAVQNRSSQSVAGMRLTVNANGAASAYSVSTLAVGASAALRIPVDRTEVQSSAGLRFVTQLINPAGLTDAIPANNRRASTLYAPATP